MVWNHHKQLPNAAHESHKLQTKQRTNPRRIEKVPNATRRHRLIGRATTNGRPLAIVTTVAVMLRARLPNETPRVSTTASVEQKKGMSTADTDKTKSFDSCCIRAHHLTRIRRKFSPISGIISNHS